MPHAVTVLLDKLFLYHMLCFSGCQTGPIKLTTTFPEGKGEGVYIQQSSELLEKSVS